MYVVIICGYNAEAFAVGRIAPGPDPMSVGLQSEPLSEPAKTKDPLMGSRGEQFQCSGSAVAEQIGCNPVLDGAHERYSRQFSAAIDHVFSDGRRQPPKSASIRWATARATSSRQGRATTCTPIGNPSSDVPARTTALGHPVRL